MAKYKLLLILTVLLFLPLLTHAATGSKCSMAMSCGFNEDWTCVGYKYPNFGTCQPSKCGDGYCNSYACATSPCQHSPNKAEETASSCPQDCKSTTTNPTPNTTPSSQYKDSDEGKSYHTQGTTTGKENNSTQTRTDACQNNQLLTEYYLDKDNNLKQQTVVCNHGCSNGMCKEKDCNGNNNSQEITNGTPIKYDYICTQRCDRIDWSSYVPKEKRYETWNYPEYFTNPPKIKFFKIKVPEEGCLGNRGEFWLSAMGVPEGIKLPECKNFNSCPMGGNMVVAYPGYDFKTKENAEKIYNELFEKQKNDPNHYGKLYPPYAYGFMQGTQYEYLAIKDINNYKGQYFYVMVVVDSLVDQYRVQPLCF